MKIILIMHNTTNKFRFKKRIAHNSLGRERYETDQANNFTEHSKFSSQYLHLARRFKIKILSDYSSGRLINSKDKITPQNEKIILSKLKTENREAFNQSSYQTPLNRFSNKQQSLSLNVNKSGELSSRSNCPVFFNMTRKSVYNETFLSNKEGGQQGKNEEGNKFKIRNNNKSLVYLGKHCMKLSGIKASLETTEVSARQVVKQIKNYILKEQDCSISHLDKNFDGLRLKKNVKKVIILERIVIVSIVCNCMNQRTGTILEESIRCLEMILGFWLQMLSMTFSQNIYKLQIEQGSEIRLIIQTLSKQQLMTKSNISLLIQTLMQKIQFLFKYFKGFYSRIVYLLPLSEELSINRSFYQLLTHFATFLNQLESQIHLSLDYNSFFATCPSPYILKPLQKSYCLVVDLDGTLIYSQTNQKSHNFAVQIRPGCEQFLLELSNYFQIILFTTSLEAYTKQVTKILKNIDYFLYRQHAVRIKNGYIKDVSRIGRDLKKVVIIDDVASNFRYQNENGIKVQKWEGNIKDEQLFFLKTALIQLAQKNLQNIVTGIEQCKLKLSELKKSSQKNMFSIKLEKITPLNVITQQIEQNNTNINI